MLVLFFLLLNVRGEVVMLYSVGSIICSLGNVCFMLFVLMSGRLRVVVVVIGMVELILLILVYVMCVIG